MKNLGLDPSCVQDDKNEDERIPGGTSGMTEKKSLESHRKELMNIRRLTLKNGLKAVIVERPDSNVVSTSVFVGAGGRYEEPANYGISHFLEHMAFKGTKKYQTAQDFAEGIESLGGKQNAWTSQDHTGFWNIVSKGHEMVALDSIAEQLSELNLDPKEIEKERGVIIEEINLYNDDPSGLVWHKLGEVLWPGQAIGSDLLGPKENIEKITREDFIKYMKPLYVAENMSVCIAGNVVAGETIEKLENTLGKIPSGEKFRPKEVIFDQSAPTTGYFEKKIDQAHCILAYKTFSMFDKRRFALDVLAAILGRGMGSVLFKEIREKRGLAYAVYVLTEYYSELGFIALYAGLNKDKAVEAVKVIKEILDKYKGEVFSPLEIKRAKEYVKGGYLISLETPQNLSNWYAEKEFLDPEKPEMAEILEMIDQVSADDLQEVAKTVFRPERESLVVLGPFKNFEKFDKIIKVKSL